ncbi:MAG: hypothetical protein IVW57_01545 [Ktedonobacterales bacterium]|nr:hypothetical protein [Ktedonobacterales bacterium]
MHPRERAIRERFERFPCVRCAVPYPPHGVVIVAHRGSVYMLLATCDDCQHRALFLASFPPRASQTAAAPALLLVVFQSPDVPDAPDAPEHVAASAPPAVTASDVAEMRRFLATFDGDFRRHFAG